MIYYVSSNASRSDTGSKAAPFQTLSQAAAIACPGDEVIVAPGIYREYVNPANGGTEENRIIYRSETPLGAVISGAEPIKNWTCYEGNVWTVRIPNGLFNSYNPYTTVIKGDWYYATKPVHTGEVLLERQIHV